MQRESAYPNPKGNPAVTPESASGASFVPPYGVPTPKPPGLWESFKGGLDSAKKYKSPSLSPQEWADYNLTRQQWLEKYPNKDRKDYGNWYQSIQKRRRKQPTNWFQRSGLSAQEWADYNLTRQQWLKKYPNKDRKDYGNWYQSVQKRRKQPTNWFQRFIPR